MKEKIEKLYIEALNADLAPSVFAEQVLSLFDVSGNYPFIKKDDLEFAVALYEENRLDAVKWLSNKIRSHSLTPLKTAKDILDRYR